jgi:putative nucleotidyltransferase with HDIG domain
MAGSLSRPRLSIAAQAYILTVVGLGCFAISSAAIELAGKPFDRQWLFLAALTLLSGALHVRLSDSAKASITISETFVFAGTLLYGTGLGTILVLLDAAAVTILLRIRRGISWHQVAFNLAAPPLSVWVAATVLFDVVGVTPNSQGGLTAHMGTARFVLGLALFTVLYFLLNSWLITLAVSLAQRTSPWRIWHGLIDLLANYASGASIAALLVYSGRGVDVMFVLLMMPLLGVIYLTYRSSAKRVEAEQQKNAELNRVFLSTIEALAMAIDAKDQVTHGHIRRVQRYTMALAEAVGIKDEKQIKALEAAALLHDTGKLAVPEYILNKPGPLTASEFERMKLHAAVGADILKSIDFPYPVEPIVRHHHENWDGTGYPDGIKGQGIPLGARILSVVDCYDALTSDRPYRPRMTRQQAEQVLRDRRGKMYDPWIVDEFLDILDRLEQQEGSGHTITIGGQSVTTPRLTPAQLEVISATTAEEREFKELSRDLPRATTLADAIEVIFRHLRRVTPAASLALYMPRNEGKENDLIVVACTGSGTSLVESQRVPVGERISGWVFAHKQVVFNSDAALDLGPVAKTLPTPLRWALVAPVFERDEVLGVISLYGTDIFDKDHKRMLETAASLFHASLATFLNQEDRPHSRQGSSQKIH